MKPFTTMLDLQLNEIKIQKIKKRAEQSKRECEMIESEEQIVSPLIQRTSRAISDWHSEADWPIHIDRAKRSIESIAETLTREGFKEAAFYLRSHIINEPKPKSKLQLTNV